MYLKFVSIEERLTLPESETVNCLRTCQVRGSTRVFECSAVAKSQQCHICSRGYSCFCTSVIPPLLMTNLPAIRSQALVQQAQIHEIGHLCHNTSIDTCHCRPKWVSSSTLEALPVSSSWNNRPHMKT